MAHHLFALLGTGTGGEGYAKAKYVLPSQLNEEWVESNFVVEAILKLYQSSHFDHVHILGTKDSAWHELYGYIKHLDKASPEVSGYKERPIDRMQDAATAFEERFGKPTSAYEITVGGFEEDIWHIFQTITDIPQSGDTVSIDITHGLRFQPLVAVLAMAYFRTIKQVEWKHLFYGAYDLARNYYEGKAPVLDLSPALTIFDWMGAATAFKDYGDTAPLVELLPEVKDAAMDLGKAQQLAMISDIPEKAKVLKSVLPIPDGNPAYELIHPIIDSSVERFAQSESDWRTLKAIAETSIQHGRLLMSVASTWEAAMVRFAELYQKPNDYDTYQRLSYFVTQSKYWKNSRLGNKDFRSAMAQIRDLRNGLAHFRFSDQSKPYELFDKFQELKTRVFSVLEDEEQILGVPQIVSWNTIDQDFEEHERKRQVKNHSEA